jgi:hypothetical protein
MAPDATATPNPGPTRPARRDWDRYPWVEERIKQTSDRIGA